MNQQYIKYWRLGDRLKSTSYCKIPSLWSCKNIKFHFISSSPSLRLDAISPQNHLKTGKSSHCVSFHLWAGEEEDGKHGHHVEALVNPGEKQVLGQVDQASQVEEESWEEVDGGDGQVDVWKRVLELSIRPSVAVSDLDKDANANKESWDGHRIKEICWGESI